MIHTLKIIVTADPQADQAVQIELSIDGHLTRIDDAAPTDWARIVACLTEILSDQAGDAINTVEHEILAEVADRQQRGAAEQRSRDAAATAWNDAVLPAR